MFPIRVKVCSESDLRMLGDLARNIQRVLPVTQADIDAAAALGKGWVVWKVIEVSDPLDNLRGGTQLIIKQNSITPGQNVRRVIFVSGPGGETVVIGPAPSPLLLPDAIANSLHYVKAFGGTEQNGTPTPDAPMDIVSNNGVLKARRRSGLPLGYTALEYLENTGTQWIDTGYILQSDDVTYEWTAEDLSTTNNTSLFGSEQTENPKYSGVLYGDKTSRRLFVGNGSVAVTYSSDSGFHDWVLSLTNDHNATLYKDGTLISNVSFSGDLQKSISIGVFNNHKSISNQYAKMMLKKFVIKDNNIVKVNLIPARRDSDGVLGMYDLADANPATAFHTNAGTGTFVAGDPVDDIEIYTDGTVETINAHGKNLFNPATTTNGFIDTSGNVQSSNNLEYSALIPVGVGKTYTWSGNNNSSTATNKRLHGYDSNGNWVEQLQVVNVQNAPYSVTATIPSGIAFVRLSGIRTDTPDTNVQFEKGSTATTYAPYYDGGTATAEMLLKVGDYQDVQSIIDGVITRNVGVKVLDGTEDGWDKTSNSFRNPSLLADKKIEKSPLICSHFKYDIGSTSTIPDDCIGTATVSTNVYFRNDALSTVEDWKQFLADQYAAGTPVIVVYPLATAATETVTGQTLQVQDGDNTLEITQASLNDLEIEAEYEQGVEALVEEIEP